MEPKIIISPELSGYSSIFPLEVFPVSFEKKNNKQNISLDTYFTSLKLL